MFAKKKSRYKLSNVFIFQVVKAMKWANDNFNFIQGSQYTKRTATVRYLVYYP